MEESDVDEYLDCYYNSDSNETDSKYSYVHYRLQIKASIAWMLPS